MAKLTFTGFEAGDNTESPGAGGTNAIDTTTKRTGGYSLRLNLSATTGFWAVNKRAASGAFTPFTETTYYITNYIYIATLPASGNNPIFRAGAGTSIGVEVRLLSDGTLELWNGTSASTATGALNTGQWYRIDVKAVRNGTCELQVDGGTAVTLTGANNALSNWYCGSRQTNVTYDVYFDDICVDDAALPGAGQCFRMDVDGNGNYTAWTGDYTDVDDVPHDTDTTYLATSTIGAEETETLESGSAAGLVGTPKSVISYGVVRDEGGVSSIQIRLRSGSTDDETGSSDPGLTYVSRAEIFNTDPADSLAWTSGDLDGLEVGPYNVASAAVRCTMLCVMVWEDGVAVGGEAVTAGWKTLMGVGA